MRSYPGGFINLFLTHILKSLNPKNKSELMSNQWDQLESPDGS